MPVKGRSKIAVDLVFIIAQSSTLRTIIDDWDPIIPPRHDLRGYVLVAFTSAEYFGKKRANGVMGV